MTIISFISFTLLVILIFTGLFKKSDFFSPARTFGLVWLTAIGLTDLKLSRLQVQWDLFGWFMLLLGLASFLLGIYICYTIFWDKKLQSVHEIRANIRNVEFDEQRLFKLIVIYFIVFATSFLLEFLIEGYIPIFTPQPDKARKMFGVFGLHLLVNGVNVILFLIAQYFIFIKGEYKRKTVLGVITIISVGSFLMLLQRYNFFILTIMIFIFLYYSGRNIRLRTYVIMLVILVGSVLLIRNLRIAQLAEFYFYYMAEMKFSVDYAIFSEPYMYIVMNLENFVHNFNKIENHALGFFTSDFLTALLGMKHWIAEYFGLEKFPHFISGYNTFPFYWAYYYDFGILGLAILPGILGFIISYTYYLLRSQPSVKRLVLYSIGFIVIVISYSSDPLTRLDMMFNFTLIYASQFFFIKVSDKT